MRQIRFNIKPTEGFYGRFFTTISAGRSGRLRPDPAPYSCDAGKSHFFQFDIFVLMPSRTVLATSGRFPGHAVSVAPPVRGTRRQCRRDASNQQVALSPSRCGGYPCWRPLLVWCTMDSPTARPAHSVAITIPSTHYAASVCQTTSFPRPRHTRIPAIAPRSRMRKPHGSLLRPRRPDGLGSAFQV